MKKSICLFCSMGCGVAFRVQGNEAVAIDYDKNNPINEGAICPRGNYCFELLNHPARLCDAYLGDKIISLYGAVAIGREKMKTTPPDSIGIFLSVNLSNEETILAAKYAEQLGTKNIVVSGSPADQEAIKGARWEVDGGNLARIDEMGKEEALFIIGDLLTRAPGMSKRVNAVKYGKRGNEIIVVDRDGSHTSWFATTHLKVNPGTEAVLMAGILKVVAEGKNAEAIMVDLNKVSAITGISEAEITRTAKRFDSAASGTVIFVPGQNSERNDLVAYFAQVLASISKNKKHVVFYSCGNTLGVNTILDQAVGERATEEELRVKIGKGEIRTALMLGSNLCASYPGIGQKVEWLISTEYFKGDNHTKNQIMLPLSSHLEGSGSYILADGRIAETQAVGKACGCGIEEVVSALMGKKFISSDVKADALVLAEKGLLREKVNLQEKLAEAMKIEPIAPFAHEKISHFGNNDLVRRFFWYRVENG